MIPIVLPFAIAVLVLVALTSLAALAFSGSSMLVESVKGRVSASSIAHNPLVRAIGAFGSNLSFQAACKVLPASEEHTPRVEGYALPQTVFYHEGHTWVAPQDGEIAVVGIDEFASTVIGTAALTAVPRAGSRVKQGGQGWTLERGGKKLDIVSPLAGKIVAVNSRVVEYPNLLSADPYGEGWLMKIKPSNVGADVCSLLHGSAARQWMERCAAEVRAMFSGDLGLVFQDGGMPLDGLADFLNMEDWNTIVSRAFAHEINKKGE